MRERFGQRPVLTAGLPPRTTLRTRSRKRRERQRGRRAEEQRTLNESRVSPLSQLSSMQCSPFPAAVGRRGEEEADQDAKAKCEDANRHAVPPSRCSGNAIQRRRWNQKAGLVPSPERGRFGLEPLARSRIGASHAITAFWTPLASSDRSPEMRNSEPGLGAWALRLADAPAEGEESRCPGSALIIGRTSGRT
jgi:hypothetical protein